jgi:signal transduction histidine kinase
MSKNNILASEGAEQLNHALQSLKSSLNDLIDITNDLIPEQTLQLGIPEYFKEICHAIEVERKITFEFTFQGEFGEMKEDARIKTYRIINTLIYIIIVQAKSTKIKMHCVFTNHVVTINGVYHRKVSQIETEDIWDSMKTKVNALNGSIDVQGSEDKLTEFTINFEVQ